MYDIIFIYFLDGPWSSIYEKHTVMDIFFFSKLGLGKKYFIELFLGITKSVHLSENKSCLEIIFFVPQVT